MTAPETSTAAVTGTPAAVDALADLLAGMYDPADEDANPVADAATILVALDNKGWRLVRVS